MLLKVSEHRVAYADPANMGFDYCGIYFALLERARTDPRIQGYEDGVFWERNAR